MGVDVELCIFKDLLNQVHTLPLAYRALPIPSALSLQNHLIFFVFDSNSRAVAHF